MGAKTALGKYAEKCKQRKTDTYIEVLPLRVTKHSGALCIFMLLS